MAERPQAAASLAVHLSVPVAELPEDAPPRRYLASRGLTTLGGQYLRWAARDTWTGALRMALRAFLDSEAVGVLVWVWVRPEDIYGDQPVEVEGVDAEGRRVPHPAGHKRHTLPGSGIGRSLFLPRKLRPFAPRLHLVEGAMDALSLLDLGLVGARDDVAAVHGCEGFRQAAIIDACRARGEVVLYPHGGDHENIGERKALELAESLGSRARVVRGASDLNDELQGAVARRTPLNGASRLYRASEVEPTWKPMVWRPWLPAGSATVLYGAPDTGKTLACTSLAMHVTRGRPLPGGNVSETGPADVAWFSLEEDPATVILPRMKAAGVDTERVWLDRLPGAHRVICGPEAGEAFVAAAKRCRLIVVDSLEAWTPDANLSKPTEARAALAWLQGIAASHPETAILVIHHDRKAAAADAQARASGSRQVTAAVESTIWLTHTGVGATRQLWWAHSKSRVSAKGESWRLELHGEPVQVRDPKTGGMRLTEHGAVRWCEQRAEMTADVLARASVRAERGGNDKGPDAEADREDAEALAEGCRDAAAAGLAEGRTRDVEGGLVVAQDWLDLVAEGLGERASGRKRARAWPRRVLKACGVEPSGRHHFAIGSQRSGWKLSDIVALIDPGGDEA